MTNFSLPNARAPAPAERDDESHAAPGNDGDALVASLQRQLGLYEQLNALSPRQAALVSGNDGNQLLALLSQRQAIIDQLQNLHGEFENLRLAARLLSASQRRDAAELHELIAAIRARILEQDERDRAALRDAKAQVGAELRKLSHVNKAAKAYGNAGSGDAVAAPMTSRFTDREG